MLHVPSGAEAPAREAADRNAFGYCDGGCLHGGVMCAATAVARDAVGVALTAAPVGGAVGVGARTKPAAPSERAGWSPNSTRET